VSDKVRHKPAWWKNTYFWLAAMLLVIGLIGLTFIGGEDSIRDPGQRRESGLAPMYLIASLVMLVNGWISHTLTMRHYEESQSGD